jgi:hypothetical protein
MSSSGSAAPGPADGSRDHYSASGNYTHAKLVKHGNKKEQKRKAKTLKNKILKNQK